MQWRNLNINATLTSKTMRGLTAAAAALQGTVWHTPGRSWSVAPAWPARRACLRCHFRTCLCTRVRTISRRLCVPMALEAMPINNSQLEFFAKIYSKRACSRSPGFGPCHVVTDFEADTRLPLVLRHTHRTTGIRKQHLTVLGGWRGATFSLPPARVRR